MLLAHTDEACRKALRIYTKADFLILDEWLLRPMNQKWSYELLELVEDRTKHGSTIFCTQYDSEEWYPRLSPDRDSPVADAVMDRIVHNAYVLAIEGNISMRERYGLAAAEIGGMI